MRQSRQLWMSLSAAAAVWGAGLSLACAQASGQNVGTPESVQPEPVPEPGTEGMDTSTQQEGTQTQQQGVQPEGVAPYEPSLPTTTTRTPTFSITDPNEPQIDARSTRTRAPNRPLLASSSLVFLGSYLPTVIYQAVDERNDNLYIPIAGPWMDMADRNQDTASKTLLALSGVAQGLGALGIVSSFFIPERRERRWYLIGGKARQAFRVSPTMARGTYGLGAMGRF